MLTLEQQELDRRLKEQEERLIEFHEKLQQLYSTVYMNNEALSYAQTWVVLIIVGLVGYMLFKGMRGLNNQMQMTEEEEKYQQEIQDLRKQIQTLALLYLDRENEKELSKCQSNYQHQQKQQQQQYVQIKQEVKEEEEEEEEILEKWEEDVQEEEKGKEPECGDQGISLQTSQVEKEEELSIPSPKDGGEYRMDELSLNPHEKEGVKSRMEKRRRSRKKNKK